MIAVMVLWYVLLKDLLTEGSNPDATKWKTHNLHLFRKILGSILLSCDGILFLLGMLESGSWHFFNLVSALLVTLIYVGLVIGAAWVAVWLSHERIEP